MKIMTAFMFAFFWILNTAYADGVLVPNVTRNGIPTSGNFTAVCVSPSCGAATASGNTGAHKRVGLPVGLYDVEVALNYSVPGREFGENLEFVIQDVPVTDGVNTLALHDFQTGVLGVRIQRGFVDVDGVVVVTRPGDPSFRLEVRPRQRFVLPVGAYSGTTTLDGRTLTLLITLTPGPGDGRENTQVRRFRFSPR